MPKYKLKSGVSKKAVVSYRPPGKNSMVTVMLEQATSQHLKDLGELGHPFVTAERAQEKSKEDGS